MKTHKIDQREGIVRLGLGIVLLIIAMEYGWTLVGTGAFVLGLISLGTAMTGTSLIGFPRKAAPVPPPELPSHLGHDVHDWAQEHHPIDTEAL